MIIPAGVLCGVLVFLIFRGFGNGPAMKEWKRKRRAHVLGLYLFGDDPVVCLRSFGQIARANAMLLLHALPALAMAAPLLAGVVLALDRYESRLHITNPAVVTARWTASCEPHLETTLPVTSPPVRIPAFNEVSWRLAAQPGAATPRAGCDGKWVSTRMEGTAPPDSWMLWFGVVTWATSWLLSVVDPVFRDRARLFRPRAQRL